MEEDATKDFLNLLDATTTPSSSSISSSSDGEGNLYSPKFSKTSTISLDSGVFGRTRPLIVSVEGNIGSGKSTLIKYFSDYKQVEAILEPVEKWTNLKGHNALDLLYKDASRWSYSFNIYASLTRLEMHQKFTIKPIKLLERSLYSTRYCFVENDYVSGTLHEMEYQLLSKWFEYLLDSEHMPIDLIVYLRTDPEKCYDRLKHRDRKEEVGVPYSLIENLHNFHEDWLIEKKYPVPAPVLVLDGNTEMPEMNNLYEKHRAEILCGYD